MDMYVVRARFGLDINLNLRCGIASVHWRVPLDLKHVHDPMDIVRSFQENIPGQKTEQGWLTIARELLLFAHDIKEGDLVFTSDTPRKQIWIGKVIKPYKYEPDLLDDDGYHIFHTLEEVRWYGQPLSRKVLAEPICTPGPGKMGLDRRGTVYLIKDCRNELLNVMTENGIHFESKSS